MERSRRRRLVWVTTAALPPVVGVCTGSEDRRTHCPVAVQCLARHPATRPPLRHRRRRLWCPRQHLGHLPPRWVYGRRRGWDRPRPRVATPAAPEAGVWVTGTPPPPPILPPQPRGPRGGRIPLGRQAVMSPAQLRRSQLEPWTEHRDHQQTVTHPTPPPKQSRRHQRRHTAGRRACGHTHPCARARGLAHRGHAPWCR